MRLKMKSILIIGGGGREHALAWKLAHSPEVEAVYLAPGNAGSVGGKLHNLPFDGANRSAWERVLLFIREKQIDLVVVGAEAPLVAGLVDFLHAAGVSRVFAPTQAGAALEGDKFFSYALMAALGIPQAEGRCCRSEEEAEAAIDALWTEAGIVLKARGLAAGKGSVVCSEREEATQALRLIQGRYGRDILVSRRLVGAECSVFGVCDGERVLAWPMAIRDYKRREDGEQGEMTGGMGAYAPAAHLSPEQIEEMTRGAIEPILAALREKGIIYRGFLYAGVMLTAEGWRILEFNTRFGDPECQPAMMLLESDLYALLDAAVEGRLDASLLRLREGAACCVVLTVPSYPHASNEALLLGELEESLEASRGRGEEVMIFHAGTRRDKTGQIWSAGGRILGVTAYSQRDLTAARDAAYAVASKIAMASGLSYRKDIGIM
jgi:phosphoribosylamine--glycine ligase